MTTKEKNMEITWTSAAQSIHNALQYTDKKNLSLSEVMGYTSHAFRINIHPEDVNIAGPTSFNAGAVQTRALANMGVRSEELAYSRPATPEQLEELIRFAQDSIDDGIPALGWDLFIPEFGLIYGYDDDKKELYAKDAAQDGVIPYANFGDIRTEVHWLMRFAELQEVTKEIMLKNALEMALEHIYNKETYPFGEWFTAFHYGLRGYDAWIHAFEKGHVDPLGNAYNSEVVSCAREYAADFFLKLQEQWSDDHDILPLLIDAHKWYGKVAEELVPLRVMYPFPDGGAPHDPDNKEKTITHLKMAKTYEEKGAAVLQAIYDRLTSC